MVEHHREGPGLVSRGHDVAQQDGGHEEDARRGAREHRCWVGADAGPPPGKDAPAHVAGVEKQVGAWDPQVRGEAVRLERLHGSDHGGDAREEGERHHEVEEHRRVEAARRAGATRAVGEGRRPGCERKLQTKKFKTLVRENQDTNPTYQPAVMSGYCDKLPFLIFTRKLSCRRTTEYH